MYLKRVLQVYRLCAAEIMRKLQHYMYMIWNVIVTGAPFDGCLFYMYMWLFSAWLSIYQLTVQRSIAVIGYTNISRQKY